MNMWRCLPEAVCAQLGEFLNVDDWRLFRRVFDGKVSRAPADVSVEFDFPFRNASAGGDSGHESRSAIATLGGEIVDKRLLNLSGGF